MAEHERILVNDKLPGAVFVLPPCLPDTDAVYEADGWHDAPEGTERPDVIGEMFRKAEEAHGREVETPEPAPDVVPADPESATKAELTEAAIALGIEVPSSATKAEIIALIEGAQTNNQEP